MKTMKVWSPLFLGICLLLSACESPSARQGTDIISGLPIVIPPGASTGPASSGDSTTPEVGASCISSDPNHYCLALKYVVYTDSSGNPVLSRDAVANDISVINRIWGQCDVGFQVDQFVEADPRSYGLTFNTANSSELDQIRSTFQRSDTLLVVTTGTWDRTGTLGSTSANAWTNMPGSQVMGVVLEAPVGDYGNIIAHELGHYLNLGHVSDASDVMNPIIYPGSTQLSSSQCDTARAAADYWWRNMIRG